MTVFLTGLLNFLQTYGYPAFGASIFVAAMGAPLPAGPLLLAAGAFAAQGDFNVGALTAIATCASVGGDCTGYLVGRVWGSRLLDWLPRSRVGGRIVTPHSADRSRLYVRRHGGWAVFMTRFLLTWLGPVTNLVAGTELYPFRSFLIWDFTGEALGAIIALTLGFVFGASWEAAGNMLVTVSLLLLGVLSVIALAYLLVRHLLREREARRHQHLSHRQAPAVAHKDE